MESSLTCDPKDRYVLAAAISSNASTIVTANLDDFPEASCTPHDLVVMHPDQFLTELLFQDPPGCAYAITRDAARRIRPSTSSQSLLAALTDVAPTFANSAHQIILDGAPAVSDIPAYVAAPEDQTPLHVWATNPDLTDPLHVALAWWHALMNRDEDFERLLSQLIVDSTESGGIVDIYEAAGLPKPSLSDLTPEFIEQAQQSSTPQLAIEALRASIVEETRRVTRNNVVRQRAFSERLSELMTRYTNQQLTSAEVIAELIEMAKEVAADADRGKRFDPPMDDDELAYYDVVSSNQSAVDVMGVGVLAQIARELVEVMRRDIRTDWTVRDDVRAKLRSSIKRLLIRHRWPPDQQKDAIMQVMQQMEASAPRFAEERRVGASR